MEGQIKVEFTPGDYMQIDIPAYDEIRFADFDIPEPYATVWRNQYVFDRVARNPEGGRRQFRSDICLGGNELLRHIH
jgi:Na+-transporting NADH:ubiquinone oxidoreductase subunit NqrF